MAVSHQDCKQFNTVFMNLPMSLLVAIVHCQATFNTIVRCQAGLEFSNAGYESGTIFSPLQFGCDSSIRSRLGVEMVTIQETPRTAVQPQRQTGAARVGHLIAGVTPQLYRGQKCYRLRNPRSIHYVIVRRDCPLPGRFQKTFALMLPKTK